jgi:hypothetical protein
MIPTCRFTPGPGYGSWYPSWRLSLSTEASGEHHGLGELLPGPMNTTSAFFAGVLFFRSIWNDTGWCQRAIIIPALFSPSGLLCLFRELIQYAGDSTDPVLIRARCLKFFKKLPVIDPGYFPGFSPHTVTIILRVRVGRTSSSRSTTCCQVPSASPPSATGMESDGPTSEAFT